MLRTFIWRSYSFLCSLTSCLTHSYLNNDTPERQKSTKSITSCFFDINLIISQPTLILIK